MASVAANTQQFGFDGFTKKNNNNPTTGGLFSFGLPTSFSGQTSNSSSTASAPLYGQTSSTNSSTTSSFGIGPFGAFRPTNDNSFTTSPQFGTSSGQSSSNSRTTSTTSPFGTVPFSVFRPTTNSFTKPPPFGIAPPSPFSQTSISSTTSPFTIAPPSPFTQTINSTTTSPFTSQTSSSQTTSPFTIGPPNPFSKTNNSPTTSPFSPAPFLFPQPSNSLTTSPTRFPFTSSMISTPTTSPSNVSLFAPFSATSIQGTRQEAYKQTAFDDPLDTAPNRKPCTIRSISAMPCYKDKTHEELRLEDYTLTGKAGTTSATTTITVPSSSVTPNSQPISQPQPLITPFSAPSFVPPTSNTYITPNIQPIAQPQPVTTPSFVPPTSNTYITPSIQPISQPVLAPLPKSGCVTENNNQQQQHVYPCPVTPMTNPFATEVRDTLPIIKPFQYGISCLPVIYENPKPAQKMPLQVNVRHLSSMGRRRLPIEKYKPNEDEKRVPFFEELPAGIYNKGARLIPRENPRSWVVLSCEEQRLETELSELCPEDSSQVHECVPKTQQNTDAIISNDHKDPSILAMIPKVRGLEYYMEPSTEDLAANELKMPGFCCKVKDFVIGRRSYGCIKFLGETDVRNLDVESVVQFSNREVEVYKDEKDKPPIGQGLNKAAEITLLNIKCIDKSTGMHYIDGPKVDKFKKLLMSKAMKQGSEFVSYDPVKGEWRFKVQHF